MSAINPASFVTPTAGLQPPNSAGPGAMGRQSPSGRRQFEPRVYGASTNATSPGYGSQGGNNRDTEAAALARLRELQDPHMSYRQTSQESLGLPSYPLLFQQQQAGMFGGYGLPQTGYSNIGIGLTGLGSTQDSQDFRNTQEIRRANPHQTDWATQFQGLSLGS